MGFIAPMLLEKVEESFNDPNYIFEPKMDGIRLIVAKSGDNISLWTRHKNLTNSQFPELLDVPVKGDVILDGEVVCVDPNTGLIDFELVMERFSIKNSEKINEVKRK